MRAARLFAALLAALAVAGAVMPAQAVAAPGPATAPEWWFDSWDVAGLWARGDTGAGVTIAVIDTGVQGSIPELAGKILPGADYTGQGGSGEVDYDSDEFGHGTAMASLMVASAGYANIQGLAPDARVLPISVPLQDTTAGAAASATALPDSIRWAADHGAKIISMSLGGYRDPTTTSEPCPTDQQDAITYAISKGAIVVAAGGNAADQGSPVEEPGVCLGVISVGAVDSTLTAGSFSSRHPYLTVSAPGVAIPTLSRIPDQAYVGQGTSQATALTSAALALVWSAYPSLSGEAIATKLLVTVQDLGPAGRDDTYGLGFIRPDQAIEQAVPADADNPVWDGIAPYLPQPSAAASPSVSVTPAATASNPPGTAVVAAAPARVPMRAVIGAAAAAWALLMLLALSLIGGRRRARRRRAIARSEAAAVIPEAEAVPIVAEAGAAPIVPVGGSSGGSSDDSPDEPPAGASSSADPPEGPAGRSDSAH